MARKHNPPCASNLPGRAQAGPSPDVPGGAHEALPTAQECADACGREVSEVPADCHGGYWLELFESLAEKDWKEYLRREIADVRACWVQAWELAAQADQVRRRIALVCAFYRPPQSALEAMMLLDGMNAAGKSPMAALVKSLRALEKELREELEVEEAS